MFEPFKNDHQSMQVGELIIENQTDKVTVYGDIDIFKTQTGLEHAQRLQRLFTNIVSELSDSLNEGSSNNSQERSHDSTMQQGEDMLEQSNSVEMVKNPFS